MGKKASRKRERRELRQGEVREQIENELILGDEEIGEEICDFCSDPEVKWAYRTKDDPTEEGGVGGWTACDACHNLIERGKVDPLARRSVRQFLNRHPELGGIPFEKLLTAFRESHDRFRAARREPAISNREYTRRYGPSIGHMRSLLENSGLKDLVNSRAAGALIGRPITPGSPLFHHAQEGSEARYTDEGFTAEQLSDPRTVQYILNRIKPDRPAPNIPLTMPVVPTIKEWVGARTYVQACAAVYGETPRADDLFAPRPSMMMAQMVLEPILRAHPLVLEPEQMNLLDHEDWSFTEAVDYAAMAYLPFEPLYLDFGGHAPVMVDLKYGPCRLYGAVIWRSGFFQTPALAVAPIGGMEYLTWPFADAMIARGIPEKDVLSYVGVRPDNDSQSFEQWRYQAAGVCWMGVESPDNSPPYSVVPRQIKQEHMGVTEVPQVMATNQAVAEAVSAPNERVKAVVLSGMNDTPDTDQTAAHSNWFRLAEGGTEMVAKLTERALMGLYFMENAPTRIKEAPLTRPQRRENERAIQKGRKPKPVASIIVINRPQSHSERREQPLGTGREMDYQIERRAHLRHYHENNRYYQNRPDLVKPCHKCQRRWDENQEALRRGEPLPYPNVESPDCIKQFIDIAFIGPEDAPLKRKVRVFKKQDEEAA